MKRTIYFLIPSMFLWIGCVSSPDKLTIDKKNDGKEFYWEYLKVEDIQAVAKHDSGGIITALVVSCGDKKCSVFGNFSQPLFRSISKGMVLDKLEVKQAGESYVVKSISVKGGIYSNLQYILAFKWLFLFLPYGVAHTISFIVPSIVFLILLFIGLLFVEW